MKLLAFLCKKSFQFRIHFYILILILLNIILCNIVTAEPYLAVRTNLKCMVCHVNPTGGGKRTEFGMAYSKSSLSAEQLLPENGVIDNSLKNHFPQLNFGGDFRFNLNSTKISGQADTSSFETQRATLYLDVALLPNRLNFYLDERIAPGAAVNREVFIIYRSKDSDFYSKIGRFFLPLGIRLEDDSAFIKSFTGINFNNSDNGVEFGFDTSSWSSVLAISNGSNGGTENNEQKQYSFRTEYYADNWRLGSSYNLNAGTNNSNREIFNIFSGVSAYGVDWLFEFDRINDQSQLINIEQEIYFIEANIEIQKGHNIKLSYDLFDPNTKISQDQQTRSSLLWEISPFEFTQVRTGLRLYDGIPQNNIQNRQELFMQLHNYF